MCGCLGLTSDIRVKAWKGKSIYRETSEGEASPAQVEPSEPGSAAPQPPRLSNMNGTDSSDIWAKAASLLGSLHTSIYERERKQYGLESWSVGLTKVACPPAAIKVCMSAHQSPWERLLQQPVNCFTVLAICPCAFIFMALKYHWADSERHERDDRKWGRTIAAVVCPGWLTSNLM